MPLLRIESRPKSGADRAPTPHRPPRGRRRDPGDERGGNATAVMGGVLVGLVLMALVAGAMVLRSRTGAPGSAVLPTPGAAGAPGAAGTPGALAPAAAPINADYPRETVVAIVRGRQYTMAELESAVRIARVLGSLTGDAVPAYDSAEMKAFQVRMLRRQVDLMLLGAAAADAGIVRPDEPVENLVDDFVARVGGTDARLQQLMAENAVTREQLNAWFEASTLANMFVAQELLKDRDVSEREQVTGEWLAKEWADRQEEILVNFYDPETLAMPTDPAGAAPPAATGDAAAGTTAAGTTAAPVAATVVPPATPPPTP